MKRYAVIGCPIEHSRSPELYNELFCRYGIEAAFEKALVTPPQFCGIRKLFAGYSGLAVTTPHKREALKIVDSASDEARLCGAVNIIKILNGEWIGHNTDGDGLCDAIKVKGFDLDGKRVVILGRGGAATSAVCALSKRGAEVALLVRTKSQASLAIPSAQILINDNYIPQRISQVYECDVFINATPLGMSGYDDFSSYDFLDGVKPRLVFDMAYLPQSQTALCQEALKRGIAAIDGYEMLKYQAFRAFQIWTGITPDELASI